MQSKPSRAAGVFIAAGALAGFTWGLLHNEASWWTLMGTLVGAAVAVGLWVADRAR